MTWMLTASGKSINLAYIDQSQLCIRDIAYALSNIRRFNGHAMRQVCVAEHSLIVCDILERHFRVTSPSVLLAGLMHDAHEAITGDVTQPMKQLLGAAWKVEEDRIQRVVLAKFGLTTAYRSHATWIHDADMFALSAEREQLMHPGGPAWDVTITHPPLDWLRMGDGSGFTDDDWRVAFLDKFNELQFAISQQQQDIPERASAGN